MVSLEERSSYQQNIESVPQLNNFYRFLSSRHQPSGSSGAEIDELINGFLSALAKDDQRTFQEALTKISQRNPVNQSQSPFVNVDILIFSIILGINRYKLDTTWIKKTLSIRSDSAATTTFKNLLQHNYNDLNNLPEVILNYKLYAMPDQVSNDLLSSTYTSIISRAGAFPGKSDFDNICMVTAFDTIVALKNYDESMLARHLEKFNNQFLKRIKILSYILNAALLFGIVWGIFTALQRVPAFATLVANFAWIAGFIGISLAGSAIPALRLKVFRVTARLFGYPKDLANKIQL